MRSALVAALSAMLGLARPAAAGDALQVVQPGARHSSLIRVEDLPREPAIQNAWAAAIAQEPYAAS